ncbi:DUF2783 domain-containing protein [Peteryoungia desertarenae]|uniref:DUF2783 domain-containing protein n=1 Tax=Peteryoungia desertarenae TaxID=1813451 RepID=UPI003CCE0F4B
MSLVTKPNLASVDDAYALLISHHKGLSEEESIAFNARLILILMNHIGDTAVLAEALSLTGQQTKPSRSDAVE